ncbi:thioredoxin family protein [Blastopirellula sp. JC732]|uniref:Thioredoxin family protein n=1 Tax=Blastopirellula sediminis TaxID=2894196 RepID=A0A9X1MIP9_9BACT|nr:thioredoxin family protein [Blastopirellula sediminis]MCC9607705.1 thioredoxin family protein [Blastopirellula sediminis]MCC9627501.1 thioredoxin family protein [Blastopirellula sediminis]
MSESLSQSLSSSDIESTPPKKRGLHFWRGFWLTFLVVSLAYAWYCFYVPSNRIAWAESYAAAQQQAAESGQPMILYFTGTWCVPCRIMKREVWADDQVAEAVNGHFIPVAIDVGNPDHAAIMARYNVGGAPVTIVVNSQGDALQWRAGGIGKAEFLELLTASESSAAQDQ